MSFCFCQSYYKADCCAKSAAALSDNEVTLAWNICSSFSYLESYDEFQTIWMNDWKPVVEMILLKKETVCVFRRSAEDEHLSLCLCQCAAVFMGTYFGNSAHQEYKTP